MLTFLGLALFFLSLSAHELGHAFAMRRNNVSIARITLLGFGTAVAQFRLRKWFGETPVFIRLYPLGASVVPADPDYVADLTYSQKVDIYGSGVVANILYSGILAALGHIVTLTVPSHGMIVLIGMAFLAGSFPRISSHLVLPIGLLCLGLLVYLLKSQGHHQFVHENGSVVAIAQDVHRYSVNILDTFVFAALMSVSIGITQALPLFILDGGRIATALIGRLIPRVEFETVQKVFMWTTLLPFLYLVLTALAGDAMRIIKLF